MINTLDFHKLAKALDVRRACADLSERWQGGNYGLQSSRLLHVASLEKLMQFCPKVITLRETLELGNCGKPDVPNLVLNSSVDHLGHVTSKGLVTV